MFLFSPSCRAFLVKIGGGYEGKSRIQWQSKAKQSKAKTTKSKTKSKAITITITITITSLRQKMQLHWSHEPYFFCSVMSWFKLLESALPLVVVALVATGNLFWN